MTRRETLAVLLAAPSAAQARRLPPLCLFSKHLPKLNWDELGKTVKQMGFDGVDLTVRAAGHVLPERAGEDLPKALDAIRAHGIEVPMITTGLVSASDPAARPTLGAAARGRVPYFKLGYWRYRNAKRVETILDDVKRDTAGLVALAKEYGIEAGFHNHSGDYVGTAVWDTRAIIGAMEPQWIGYYYDPCHATAEGGVYGWRLSLQVALPRIKMVALKDFYWAKKGREWKMTMCPLGEGMVDWKTVFGDLARGNFSGPISLHVEYETPDEPAAIARDFEFMKKTITAAYGAKT
ncbi:MAG: sugar phosphate isomerase/epimerase family protein [Bryobacteraceae bacterium]